MIRKIGASSAALAFVNIFMSLRTLKRRLDRLDGNGREPQPEVLEVLVIAVARGRARHAPSFFVQFSPAGAPPPRDGGQRLRPERLGSGPQSRRPGREHQDAGTEEVRPPRGGGSHPPLGSRPLGYSQGPGLFASPRRSPGHKNNPPFLCPLSRVVRVGDAMVRVTLYGAANIMLSRVTRFSSLKRWALDVAKRRGLKRAKVALARKLATVLHHMWIDGTTFHWGQQAVA